MPQLNQLSDVLFSQLFWLAIGLGFIFFVVARGMVPKIQATVDAREAKILVRRRTQDVQNPAFGVSRVRAGGDVS